MTAYDWAVVAAVCALTVTFIHYCHRGDDRNAWQQSTGSSPQTVADDVVEHRREREIAELEIWLQLPLQPRHTLPTQRQPRKDQP